MGGSEKAKQKKAERKAMEKKMNEGFANVKLANSKVSFIFQFLDFTRLQYKKKILFNSKCLPVCLKRDILGPYLKYTV